MAKHKQVLRAREDVLERFGIEKPIKMGFIIYHRFNRTTYDMLEDLVYHFNAAGLAADFIESDLIQGDVGIWYADRNPIVSELKNYLNKTITDVYGEDENDDEEAEEN